jgi:hypothetical protein
LASEWGCTLFSAKRACKALETAGWAERNKGGGLDKTSFKLFIPSDAPVSTTDTGPDIEASIPVSKIGGTGIQNGGGTGIHHGFAKEH